MLTEEQKARIREEEYFKHEVRKSLEKNQESSFRSRVWMILNSSFGLWLLSTVVVGSIVYLYSDFQKRTANEASQKETHRKLEIEISNRIQYFQNELKSVLSDEDRFGPGYVVSIAQAVDAGESKDYAPTHIFPEFKSRTLQSLLFELEQSASNDEESKDLKDARRIMSKAKQMLFDLPGTFFPEEKQKEKQIELDKRKQEVYNLYRSTLNEIVKLLNGNRFLKNRLDS